jgi:hypothetical protein
MRARSLVSLVALLTLLGGWTGAAGACEKHLKGHQNSSDSQAEVGGR